MADVLGGNGKTDLRSERESGGLDAIKDMLQPIIQGGRLRTRPTGRNGGNSEEELDPRRGVRECARRQELGPDHLGVKGISFFSVGMGRKPRVFAACGGHLPRTERIIEHL